MSIEDSIAMEDAIEHSAFIKTNQYKEFIEKFTRFMNLIQIIMFKKKYQKIYTFESGKDRFYRFLSEEHDNFDIKIRHKMLDVQVIRDNGRDIVHTMIYNFMPCEKVFKPYRSYDYSFLDKYSENVKKTLILQIDYESGSIDKPDYMYKYINNIDDLLAVMEIYVNPPNELIRISGRDYK